METVLWWVLVLQPLSNAMFLQGWATQQCLFVWHVSFDWLRWKLFMPNVCTSLYTTGHSFPRCTWNNQISYHSISHGDHHVCPYICRYHVLHISWQWICELVFTSEQLDYCYAILTLRLVLFSVWILITSRTLSFRKRSQQTMMTVLVFVANFPLRIWLVFNV